MIDESEAKVRYLIIRIIDSIKMQQTVRTGKCLNILSFGRMF